MSLRGARRELGAAQKLDRPKDQRRAPGRFLPDRAGKATVASKDDLKATVISGLRWPAETPRPRAGIPRRSAALHHR